jgi:flagellar basal-body rod protein FlgG
MAVTALHTAATGLSALSQQLDIIANNLANVNTAGFKSFRANLEDLMYQEKAQPGIENGNGDQRPAGLFVGLGTRISNTQPDFTKGSPQESGRDLDMMIDGAGFFRVKVAQDQGTGIGYSRAGNFFLNKNSQIVLGNSQGQLLDPAITVPQEATAINVSADGIVYATVPTAVAPQNVGQLQLANFVNPAGLKPLGGNLFVETDASGQAIEGTPGEGGFGAIIQKFLESSNVDAVKELVSLIKTQRAFEMNSQSIQAADQALQVISNLRRG